MYAAIGMSIPLGVFAILGLIVWMETGLEENQKEQPTPQQPAAAPPESAPILTVVQPAPVPEPAAEPLTPALAA